MKTNDVATRAVKFIKRHPIAISLAAIFALYFVTRLVCLKSLPIFCDEAVYIRWAKNVLHDHDWFVTLGDGKPPLHPWAIVPFLKMVKDPLVAGRLVSVFAGALTTLGIFLMGRDFKDSRFGALASLLYVVCPFTLWFDRLALTESLLIAIVVFSLFFAVRAAVSGNLLYLIGTGITAGIALLTKGTAFFLFMIVPFAYVLRHPYQKGREKARPLLRWLLAVALSLLLGYGIYSLLRLKISFGLLLDTSANRTLPLSELLTHPFALFPKNIGILVRNLFVLMTPVFFIICFLGLFLGILRKWRPSIFLCIWFLVPVVIVSATSISDFPRFFLISVPPLLFGAAYFVTHLLELFRRARSQGSERGMAVVAALLVILLLAVSIPVGMKLVPMITAPAEAGLPHELQCQYVEGWSAGWGIEETADFLEIESDKENILVGTNDGFFPGYALSVYFFGNSNIDYIVASLDQLRGYMEEAVEKRPCYCVLNDLDELPRGWPLREIMRFPRGKGRYMFLAEYLPKS